MAALLVVRLGCVPYGEALELQRAAAAARISGALANDLLFLVEHPAVVTFGRSARRENLLESVPALAERGVELFDVERGGDVTFHGPGQIVGYPIVDLRRHREDLHWYLRQLEEVLIVALAELGVASERRPGLTGVWTTNLRGAASEAGAVEEAQGRKIASIGVHARNWVTWHGFALNVTTDLSYFDAMIPCGIDGVQMTSVARETGKPVALLEAGQAVEQAFARVFCLDPVVVTRDSLPLAAGITG